jgi:hypothetical protein
MTKDFIFTNGRLDIADTPFCGGAVTFETAVRRIASTALGWQGNIGTADGFKVVVHAGNTLQFEVSAPGEKLLNIWIDFPADILSADDYLEYIHTRHFVHPCVIKKVGRVSRFDSVERDSSMLYLLHERNNNGSYLFCVCGEHPGDYVYFSPVHSSGDHDSRFGLKICFEIMAQSGKLYSSAIFCESANDPLQLLHRAGEMLAEPNLIKERALGWNSWDYFAGSVAAEDMYRNQAAMKNLSQDLKYCVIDAGYYPRWGEWEAGEKFAEGFDAYCRNISSTGSIPGIWTAPGCMNTSSRFYAQHPECFGRKADGSIAVKTFGYGAAAFLDITHPRSREYIIDSFLRLKAAGFKYFKVDFTYEVTENCQIFYDKSVPLGMITRKLFETIRETVGADSYILACGAPYEAVRGLVNAVRSCNDIHTYWSHVLFCAASISARYWMNQKIWNLDPDFLIVRTPENCSSKQLNPPSSPHPFTVNQNGYWCSGRLTNLRELKSWLLLTLVSCGDMFLSDDLPSLNPEALAILKKIVEHRLIKPAVPVDLFEKHDTLPSIWMNDEFAGVFNFTEDQKTINVKLTGKTTIGNSFFGDYAAVPNSDGFSVILPPHSAEGFYLTQA